MKETFAIASGGTLSNYLNTPGYKLVGLFLPTMDSTTVQFEFDEDGSGNGVDLYISTHGVAPAALNLGTAATTARFVAVPEEVGRLFDVLFGRLEVAAQNGGARTVVAYFQRIR